MSATIERSFYIEIVKTKFGLFDDVKLKLGNKKIISGQIVDIGENTVTLENIDGNHFEIFVEDIEDYISN